MERASPDLLRACLDRGVHGQLVVVKMLVGKHGAMVNQLVGRSPLDVVADETTAYYLLSHGATFNYTRPRDVHLLPMLEAGNSMEYWQGKLHVIEDLAEMDLMVVAIDKFDVIKLWPNVLLRYLGMLCRVGYDRSS